MIKDPEVNICYSLKSFSISEEIIGLNVVVICRQLLNVSLASMEVTFQRVHSILHGDSSSKLIYRFRKNILIEHWISHTHILILQRILFLPLSKELIQV